MEEAEEVIEPGSHAFVSKLIKQYSEERVTVTKDVKELTRIFNDIKLLGDNQGKFYTKRQELVERKFELMTYNNAVNRLVIVEKKKTMDHYKFGMKPEPNRSTGIVLKNDMEREIYIGHDNRNFDHLMKTVDDQLNFVTDTISTVDRMIYGFEYAIAFSKMKQNM